MNLNNPTIISVIMSGSTEYHLFETTKNTFLKVPEGTKADSSKMYWGITTRNNQVVGVSYIAKGKSRRMSEQNIPRSIKAMLLISGDLAA